MPLSLELSTGHLNTALCTSYTQVVSPSPLKNIQMELSSSEQLLVPGVQGHPLDS